MTGYSADTVARQFRVERSENGGVTLRHREDAEQQVEIRRTPVNVTIEARDLRVCRSLVPGGLDRWLTSDVVKLSIGIEDDLTDLMVWDDDEGVLSAENTVFGIHDDDLVPLEMTFARMVNIEARDDYGYPFIGDSRDPTSSTNDGELDNEAGAEEERDAPVAELWHHIHEDALQTYSRSLLVLTVAFPEPQLSDLIEACESGRAETLLLECGGYAKAATWAFTSAREIILDRDETLGLLVEDATIISPVVTGEAANAASSTECSGEHQPQSSELAPDDRNLPRGGSAASYTLLGTTSALCILSSLFGAGAIAVLTIAVLGGTAALIARPDATQK